MKKSLSAFVALAFSLLCGQALHAQACQIDFQQTHNPGSTTITVIGNGIDQYLWSNNATTQTITVTTAGTYTVTVTDWQGGPCTAVASKTVSVNPPLNPTISANGPTTFCIGGSVTLTSSPAQTYLWNNGQTTQSIFVTQPGNYSVMQTNGNCSGTSNVINVNVGQTPQVFNVTGGGGFCLSQGGVAIGISGSQSGVQYQLKLNNNTVTTVQGTGGAISFGNQSNTGTYTVMAVQGGCTAQMNGSATVTVFPSPTVNNPGTQNICEGQQLNLAFSGSQGATFSWNSNQNCIGVPLSGSGNLQFTGNNSGSINVTVVPTADQCVGQSQTFTVNVNPIPQVPVIVPNINVNTQTASLSVNGSQGNYTWSGPGNFTGSGQSVNLPWPPVSGNYTVTLTVNGCSATDVAAIAQFCPVVPQNPVASFMASVNSGCAPVQINFTNTSQNATSYLWNFGDGITTNQTSPSHTYTQPGTYVVTLTATNANGSTHSFLQTITVNNCNPACNMTAAVTAMDATCFGCNNGSVWTTVTNGTLPLSYVWSFNGVVNNALNTSDISNLVSGTYCVTVTDGNGCTATSCAFVDQSMNNPAPVADFTQTRVDCGITYLFDASPSLNNPTTFFWDFGAGAVPATSTDEYPVVSFYTKGDKVIKLTVTDGNGNSDTEVRIVNVQGITVNQGILSGGSIEQHSYLTLQAPSGAHYNWGGVGGDVQEIPTLTSTLGVQNFSVTVTQSNGSTAVYCFVVNVVPGVSGGNEPDGFSGKIKTFPNPTNSFVTIEGLELLTDVTVFNEVGKFLSQEEYDGEVNLSSFPAGIYFIAAPGMKTQRVVKQ
jgi:PKD repeat protein